MLSEATLLPVIQEQLAQPATPPRAWTLCKKEGGAVVGLAAWSHDPLWPGRCVADVYCHPNFWSEGDALLQQLTLPEAERIIAYADAASPEKIACLEAAGFEKLTTLPQWIARDAAHSGYDDVLILEKRA
jgi:hypothetical protein